MYQDFHLAIRDAIKLIADGQTLRLVEQDGSSVRIQNPGTAIETMLQDLFAGGCDETALMEKAMRSEPGVDATVLYFVLAKLHSRSLLTYTLHRSGQPLATLTPMTHAFRWQAVSQCASAFRLSRFASVQAHKHSLVVHCALSHARLTVHDARLMVWIGQLAKPQTIGDLYPVLEDSDRPAASQFMALLVAMGAVYCCDSNGRIPEDEDPALRQWETHDLMFHARSRMGRHDYPLGRTFPFLRKLPHAAALRDADSGRIVCLRQPTADLTPATGFFNVLDARRSLRKRGIAAINLDALAAFLWYVHRVVSHRPADPNDPRQYEATYRPVAGGGAIHELELYLTIDRCQGLLPGLYRYLPHQHALDVVAAMGPDQRALLEMAQRASGAPEPPDILITIASHFPRMAWKYQSIAYATTLKNVGVLYQQMYLVATALKLAPCALGGGDSAQFARATGRAFHEEGSVGEFMLSAAAASE